MSWGFQVNVGQVLHSVSGADTSQDTNQFEVNLERNFSNLLINGSKAGPRHSGHTGLGSFAGPVTSASSDAALAELVSIAPPGYQLDPPLQISLHQLQVLGSSVLGWQVMVESAEGTYVGHVCWLLDHCSRLGLEQVTRPGSDVRRVGLLLLYYRHIHRVTLLGRRPHDPHRTRQQRSNVLEERSGRSLLMKKIVPPHLLERRLDELEEEEEDEEAGEGEPLPPPCGGLQRPNDWLVIDALDDAYQHAVSAIASCRRVGLSCVGQQVGRWGVLAWLCIATPERVYLFDVATLGLHATLWGQQEARSGRRRPGQGGGAAGEGVGSRGRSCEEEAAVDGGSTREASPASAQALGEPGEGDATQDVDAAPGGALEPATEQLEEDGLSVPADDAAPSPSQEGLGAASASADLELVQQAPRRPSLGSALQGGALQVVLHDARCLVDLLQHQAGLALPALHDTQATEVYLHLLQHRGDCPAFVPSLGALLTRRLGLAPHHLLFDRAHRRHGGDSSVYFERPLPSAVLAGLASSAMFLCELRHLQLFELLADLRQLTAVHAASYALRDDHTRTRVEQHMVPDSVQQLGRRTVLNCLPPATTTRAPASGRHHLSPAF